MTGIPSKYVAATLEERLKKGFLCFRIEIPSKCIAATLEFKRLKRGSVALELMFVRSNQGTYTPCCQFDILILEKVLKLVLKSFPDTFKKAACALALVTDKRHQKQL